MRVLRGNWAVPVGSSRGGSAVLLYGMMKDFFLMVR